MNDAVTKMSAALTSEGLLTPPIGGDPTSVQECRRWCWGSSEIPENLLYMFRWNEVAQRFARNEPFFALNHEGHGVNSYGLNLVTYSGEIAAFFQYGYGGIYMSPLLSRLAINGAYTHLHVLLGLQRESDRRPPAHPKALLVYSDFRDTSAVVDLEGIREGLTIREATRDLRGFRQLMCVATKLVPERNIEIPGCKDEEDDLFG